METLGTRLRKKRLRLGLTLDDLAARTGISKPYLSLIETGRTSNPPSDEKLRRLEQVLGFNANELLTQAHLHRTPQDVRAMLQRLLRKNAQGEGDSSDCVDLDQAYMSGVLQEMAESSAGNIEQVSTRSVPVINRVSAGYPTDFTDLSYPRGVADDYVGCPDVRDEQAFAARVFGDSMAPKYRQGEIVIFSPAAATHSGDDCFVRFDDCSTTFKRVFFENDEAGQPVIRLQPRNERYRPQTVPASQITGLYKAVFKYQPVEAD